MITRSPEQPASQEAEQGTSFPGHVLARCLQVGLRPCTTEHHPAQGARACWQELTYLARSFAIDGDDIKYKSAHFSECSSRWHLTANRCWLSMTEIGHPGLSPMDGPEAQLALPYIALVPASMHHDLPWITKAYVHGAASIHTWTCGHMYICGNQSTNLTSVCLG